MNLLEVVREVRRHLEQNGHASLRMLRRQFEYVLVGRNLLRTLIVRLDGPGEQLDLRRPRPHPGGRRVARHQVSVFSTARAASRG